MSCRFLSLCRFVILCALVSTGSTFAMESGLRDDDRLFRSLYGSELENSGYSVQEIAKLHLTYPQLFKDFIESCNKQAETIADCDVGAVNFRPTYLLKESVTTRISPPVQPHKERPTFIILPGYVAELAEITPYSDILEQPSQLKEQWLKKVAAANLKTGPHYSIIQGRDVQSPITSLIQAASLDQADGTATAHIFVIQHPLGSLESIGQLADNADSIIPRIRQLNQIMPLEGPIYLLGYSRGANVALEIISRLPQLEARGQDPWAQKIAGMISLSGPLFGTTLSDSTAPNPLAGLLGFTQDLQSCEANDSFLQRRKKIHSNTRLWKQSIGAILRDGGGLTGPEELELEGIKTGLIDLRMSAQVLKAVLFKDLFRLGRPVSEYCENVDRFKLFVAKVLEGADVMSTQNMQTWFQTHTLPPELDYIAVGATMMDASTVGNVQPEGSNALCYTPSSADLQLSRSSYYQIFNASGFHLNDGFVPLHRSLFLPALHQKLNPAQQPYRARYLGALWQHHLGIAIPMGIPMANTAKTPFPRRDFLEALARLTLSRQ